jgi:PBSX family phage terminase large subunit
MAWKPFPCDSKGFDVWNEFCEDSDSTYFLLHGAVRSSKTFASLLAFCDKVEHCRPGPIGMMGKTERTLRQNILDPMRELINDNTKFQLNQGQGELTLFGRKIYLVGAPNIAAVSKIQGKGFVMVYCDEAETYPPEVWDMLGTRTDAGGVQILATMNPGGPRAHMKVNYLDRLNEVDGRAWHFTLDDNPFLSAKVKNRLKTQYTGLWYKRYILGLWVAAEGAVYDMFRESDHVVGGTLPKFSKIITGVDYGTSNATVFISLGRIADGEHVNKWMAFKEYYYDSRKSGRQKTDREYSDDMKTFHDTPPDSVQVDPSAASFKLQLARDKVARRIEDADNSVLDGIRSVSQGFSTGDLLIHDSCSHLIDEILGYSWNAKAQANGIDEPVKIDDHACDALRYAYRRACLKSPVYTFAAPSEISSSGIALP